MANVTGLARAASRAGLRLRYCRNARTIIAIQPIRPHATTMRTNTAGSASPGSPDARLSTTKP